MEEPQQSQRPLEVAMGKGDGEASYTKNSGFQAFINKIPLSYLKESLQKVKVPSGCTGPVVVARSGKWVGTQRY
jgi:hypothetical protein